MLIDEYTDAEIEELDTYLTDEWNHDIYEDLCGENHDLYEGLFDPLEFFRLLYAQIKFVEDNKAKPLFISRSLKKLSYNDKQLDYIYFKIEMYFDDDKEDDEKLNVCCREISKLRNNLDTEDEDEDEATSEHPYDFKIVLDHIETLNSTREKIAYLIEKKTSWQQSFYAGMNSQNPSFAEQCRLEIEKLEKLSRLQPLSPNIETKYIEVAKHKDLTIDRTILLLSRLIPSFSACDATKKAEFINFLTGFDDETTRQRFSSIHKKDSEKSQAFKKDMDIVCKYLDLLGLQRLVREVKKDLDFN